VNGIFQNPSACPVIRTDNPLEIAMPSAGKSDLNAGGVLKKRKVKTITALVTTGSPMMKLVTSKGLQSIILKNAAAVQKGNSGIKRSRSITGEKTEYNRPIPVMVWPYPPINLY